MFIIDGSKNFFRQDFFQNTLVHWAIIASLMINAICFGSMAFFIRPVDFPIILHYNVHFGVDVIGTWWQAYFLPVISLAITLINTILGLFFYENGERIISYVLLMSSFMVQVGMAIAIGSIIRINY